MANRMTLAAAALALLLPLHAQESGAHLPPEDPMLYQLFFGFHEGLNTAIQNKKAQNLESGTRSEKGFANKLRIKQDEIQTVTNVSHRFVTDLAAWQSDLKSYVDRVRSQKQEPDPAVLQQFNQRKRQLIDEAVRQIRTTLSPASWTGLHAYINDEHRLHTTMTEFNSTPISAPVTAKP